MQGYLRVFKGTECYLKAVRVRNGLKGYVRVFKGLIGFIRAFALKKGT